MTIHYEKPRLRFESLELEPDPRRGFAPHLGKIPPVLWDIWQQLARMGIGFRLDKKLARSIPG
jgi:hypothetical protein